MRLYLLISMLCFLSAFPSYSQKASDVLENGIVVKPDKIIFLKLSGNRLKYSIWNDKNVHPNYITLEDSTIFLVPQDAVNVYLKPINPLNYSYKTEIKIVTDQVEEDASNALKSIIDLQNLVQKAAGGADPCPYKKFEADTKLLQDSLNVDMKDDVASAFKTLKSITFNNETHTRDTIAIAKSELQLIEDHYTRIGNGIKALRSSIGNFNCKAEEFIVKHVLNNIVAEVENAKNEQYKRVKILKGALALVETAYNKSKVDDEGLTWLLPLEEAPSKHGKVSLYTITINESGYKLSDKDEIVEMETKESLKRVLRIRSFRRFVPEVSAGIAYTDLSFPKYGTSKDTTNGGEIVAAAGEENFKKMNVTAMLNLNYFIPNSPLHPFLQMGIGANADYPTALAGFGFRLNFKPLRRLAFSYGYAATWINKLDKLKIGDKVSGTAEIEEDLKHEFQWPPKPYIGVQINF